MKKGPSPLPCRHHPPASPAAMGLGGRGGSGIWVSVAWGLAVLVVGVVSVVASASVLGLLTAAGVVCWRLPVCVCVCVWLWGIAIFTRSPGLARMATMASSGRVTPIVCVWWLCVPCSIFPVRYLSLPARYFSLISVLPAATTPTLRPLALVLHTRHAHRSPLCHCKYHPPPSVLLATPCSPSAALIPTPRFPLSVCLFYCAARSCKGAGLLARWSEPLVIWCHC